MANGARAGIRVNGTKVKKYELSCRSGLDGKRNVRSEQIVQSVPNYGSNGSLLPAKVRKSETDDSSVVRRDRYRLIYLFFIVVSASCGR